MYSNIDEAWKVSNDLDKYKNSFKPVTSVKNATNELTEINIETTERPISEKIESEHRNKSSSPSSAIFQTEVHDIKKLVHRDDGTQCNKLFSHFQSCKKCRNKLIAKNIFNKGNKSANGSANNSIHGSANGSIHGSTNRSMNRSINESLDVSNNITNLSLDSFRLTENFVDFTKYTDLLKNKNNSNIVSIILFGLLVIIILSLINNG
jgi:hypothetical protein